MFAICIESSHEKGMGHLYRALNFSSYLKKVSVDHVIIVNDNNSAKNILEEKGKRFEVADLADESGNWEHSVIKKYGISVWINDRLGTELQHSKNIKKHNVLLVAFDDDGVGAELADLNFGMLPVNYNRRLTGRSVKAGLDYFILNDEVFLYRKKRSKLEKIIVTLGGSDTYGVTVKVAEALKRSKLDVTVITGPSFEHSRELAALINPSFIVKNSVPSLIREFSDYDLAITGGGITPFEANASGLPCMIIANEIHEVENAMFLEKTGSSAFMGYHSDVVFSSITFDGMNIKKMSEAGINAFHSKGAENVYNAIKAL